MRISTSMFQQASLNGVLEQQVKLSQTQQQLATGKRMLVPSDDPIASATLVDINQSLSMFNQYNRNADYADMRLKTEESVLGSVSNVLQRTRELAVQGNNETYSAEQRKYIASEVRQLLDEALTLANTSDDGNNYIFSGAMSNTRPFEQVAPGEGALSTFNYNGDQSQRKLQIGTQRMVADGDPGYEVFGKVRLSRTELGPIGHTYFSNNPAEFSVDGATITLDRDYPNLDGMVTAIRDQLSGASGQYEVDSERGFISISNKAQDASPVLVQLGGSGEPKVASALAAGIRPVDSTISVFEAIDRLAVALENNQMSGTRISDIDAALSHIVNFKSEIGGRMSSVDRQRTVNEDMVFQMTNIKSELEDLDYASAVSKMNLQMVGMQAAQQTFTKVQNLSLFNYL